MLRYLKEININISKSENPNWIHPWNVEVFDETTQDNRFFSIVLKGLLDYLNTTIKLYNKPIHHLIVQTGKEYLYQESNGYNFSWTQTTGEDYPYFHKPRGVIRWEEISIDTKRMSSPFARGLYDRTYTVDGNKQIGEFSSEIKIIPVEMPIELTYVLSNFNESIVLTEELLSHFIFVKYFYVTYLGRLIQCSIEFPESYTPAKTLKLNYDAETKDRLLEIKLDIKTIFPVMIESSEVDSSKIISSWEQKITIN